MTWKSRNSQRRMTLLVVCICHSESRPGRGRPTLFTAILRHAPRGALCRGRSSERAKPGSVASTDFEACRPNKCLSACVALREAGAQGAHNSLAAGIWSSLLQHCNVSLSPRSSQRTNDDGGDDEPETVRSIFTVCRRKNPWTDVISLSPGPFLQINKYLPPGHRQRLPSIFHHSHHQAHLF